MNYNNNIQYQQQPKQENPLSFLKGGDSDFNQAMESLDVMFDDMYQPVNKNANIKAPQKQEYMGQENFKWLDNMYNDIMEPSQEEKIQQQKDLQRIQMEKQQIRQKHLHEQEQRAQQILQQHQQQQNNIKQKNKNGQYVALNNQQGIQHGYGLQQQQQQNQSSQNIVYGEPILISQPIQQQQQQQIQNQDYVKYQPQNMQYAKPQDYSINTNYNSSSQFSGSSYLFDDNNVNYDYPRESFANE